MADPNGADGVVDASGLRERLPQNPEAPQKAASEQTAQEAVRSLNDSEAKEDKAEKDKRTFGRTLDGTGAYPRASAGVPCGRRIYDENDDYHKLLLRQTCSQRPCHQRQS